MKQVRLSINPGRVLFGFSRIGYTPASAICDIIDNSIMANAKNIYILIRKENEKYKDTRQGNVKDYLIIDDGDGMDEKAIEQALELGSSDAFYGESTLSKFGLGMKSATFSQGDELEVISGRDGNFLKYIVSLPEVQESDDYFANQVDLDEEDEYLISTYLNEGKGTIVKIGKVRMEGHPSIKHTIEELKEKVGVIYYYFLRNDGVKIFIENEQLPAIDVLFCEEADLNGNLDENTWTGRDVRWIEKPKEILLDSESNVRAVIEVTQLPHPPTFRLEKRGGDTEIREKYLIESANYGFYVYRNKRLISWAETFKGIIPMNQDLYSFRGRILIDDTADDTFNIDVKKSTITLSDEAWNVISDKSREWKKKSINAWGRAKTLVNERKAEDPHQTSNEIINDLEIPETLPGTEPLEADVLEEVEQEVIEKSKKRIEKIRRIVEEEIQEEADLGDGSEEKISTEEIDAIALKGDTNPYSTKIFKVGYTEDNSLWEPYYDTDLQYCVRINKHHRFAKLIFDDNGENTDLQVIFELMLHQFAVSEVESLKHLKSAFPKIDVKTLDKILAEYRRLTSEYLANMVRKLEDKLPPLSE